MTKLLVISFASLMMLGAASAAWAEDYNGPRGTPNPAIQDPQNPGLGAGITPPTNGGGANDMGQSTLRYDRSHGERD